MKKVISLLLVLVLSLGMLSGVSLAAAKPEECTEAEAAVMVTCAGDETVSYFPELTQKILDWTMAELTTGMRTITFLKDIDSSETEAATSGAFIELGSATSQWGKKNHEKLIFDLNGHTWSYTGPRNLIYSLRWGCTITNGTINYNCTNEESDHFLFASGSWKGLVTDSSVYDPKLVLDNLTIIDGSNIKNHHMLRTFNYEADYTIQNSTVFVENGDVMMLFKGTQEEAVTATGETRIYEGDFNSRLNVKNSVIVTPNGALIATSEETPDTGYVTIEDSLVVGSLKADVCNATIKTDEATVTEGYNITVGEKSAAGTAYVYGTAPGYEAPKMPFTDVAEADWFHSFVSEMYFKGVINGMTETTFVPNGTLTYGQALKLVTVGLGLGEQAATADHWAGGYLALAKAQGWVDSDADLNGAVSRLAFCKIAAKAASLDAQPASNPFTDTADTDVLALVNAGVINGMSDTIFMPDGLLTRAQIAKIISLLVKL